MTRLAHLTDLHFGLHRPELVGPLRDAIRRSTPDLVVVSGDLSQRALRAQFRQAVTFLRDLEVPFLVVPGNHDVPLYNPVSRLLRPFGPFRAVAGPALSPAMRVGGVRLFSLNTADPFQWRGGRVRGAEIDDICNQMRDGASGVTNVLVAHHPFEEPPGFNRGETRGAKAALERLAEAGLHLLLTGHLHHWAIGLGISKDTSRAILQMQTGTALCARTRERDHGMAILDFAAEGVSITPWIVDEASLRYTPRSASSYARRDGRWLRVA